MDGRTAEPAYTISSPGAFGSGELKIQGIQLFSFFLLIYVEMPTIVGISTFISRKNFMLS